MMRRPSECLGHVLQDFPCCLPVCLVNQLGHGKLALAINPDEQKQPALSDVDVKEAAGIALELLPLRLVALHVRRLRNAFPTGLEPMASQWLIAADTDGALSA